MPSQFAIELIDLETIGKAAVWCISWHATLRPTKAQHGMGLVPEQVALDAAYLTLMAIITSRCTSSIGPDADTLASKMGTLRHT